MCFSKMEYKNQDVLDRPIYYSTLDDSLWNDKCDYLLLDSCTNINPKNYNMVIMQLNIRSMLSKQTELNQLLNLLNNKNSKVDALLLCETFLSSDKIGLTCFPGYKLISNHRKKGNGGGTAILLKEGISFKRRPDLDIFLEKDVESVFVEITAKNGKPIIIGSMYQLPKSESDSFTDLIVNIASRIKKEKEKKN